MKATSACLAAVTALFYFVSLSAIIPARLTGGVPPSVADAGTPTGSPHVLDMAGMLPAKGLTAVWLWRGRPIAYPLAGALLAFLSLMTLAIGAMIVVGAQGGSEALEGLGRQSAAGLDAPRHEIVCKGARS